MIRLAGLFIVGLSSTAWAQPGAEEARQPRLTMISAVAQQQPIRPLAEPARSAQAADDEQPSAEWLAKFVRPCAKSGNRLSC